MSYTKGQRRRITRKGEEKDNNKKRRSERRSTKDMMGVVLACLVCFSSFLLFVDFSPSDSHFSPSLSLPVSPLFFPLVRFFVGLFLSFVIQSSLFLSFSVSLPCFLPLDGGEFEEARGLNTR